MHPYRGIVYTYIRSYGISTIPDDQNTLTLQSADIKNAPRDPLLGPVTQGLVQHRIDSNNKKNLNSENN